MTTTPIREIEKRLCQKAYSRMETPERARAVVADVAVLERLKVGLPAELKGAVDQAVCELVKVGVACQSELLGEDATAEECQAAMNVCAMRYRHSFNKDKAVDGWESDLRRVRKLHSKRVENGNYGLKAVLIEACQSVLEEVKEESVGRKLRESAKRWANEANSPVAAASRQIGTHKSTAPTSIAELATIARGRYGNGNLVVNRK